MGELAAVEVVGEVGEVEAVGEGEDVGEGEGVVSTLGIFSPVLWILTISTRRRGKLIVKPQHHPRGDMRRGEIFVTLCSI